MNRAEAMNVEAMYINVRNARILAAHRRGVRLADTRDPVQEAVERIDPKYRETVRNILSAIATDLDVTTATVEQLDDQLAALRAAGSVLDRFRTLAMPPIEEGWDTPQGDVNAALSSKTTGASRQGESSMQTVINLAAHSGRNTTEKLMSYLRAQNPTRQWQHAKLVKAAGELRRRSDVRIVDSAAGTTLSSGAPVINLADHPGRNVTERLMSYALSQNPNLTHFEALNQAKALRRTHRIEGA